jgi:hypothetical protein
VLGLCNESFKICGGRCSRKCQMKECDRVGQPCDSVPATAKDARSNRVGKRSGSAAVAGRPGVAKGTASLKQDSGFEDTQTHTHTHIHTHTHTYTHSNTQTALSHRGAPSCAVPTRHAQLSAVRRSPRRALIII